MRRAFEGFDEFVHVPEARAEPGAQRKRLHHEALPLLRVTARHDAVANQRIHDALEGFAGLAHLLFHHPRYVVVERKSRSHIMMLRGKHHDVKAGDSQACWECYRSSRENCTGPGEPSEILSSTLWRLWKC